MTQAGPKTRQIRANLRWPTSWTIAGVASGLVQRRGRIGRWRGRRASDQPRAHTGAASGHEHRHAAFRSAASDPVSRTPISFCCVSVIRLRSDGQ